jgi:O-antigen biosynthesis protein WbqP
LALLRIVILRCRHLRGALAFFQRRRWYSTALLRVWCRLRFAAAEFFHAHRLGHWQNSSPRSMCWLLALRVRLRKNLENRLAPGHHCMKNPLKRAFDLALGTVSGVFLLLPVLLIALMVRLTSRGPVLYWSDRVGRNNLIFRMPKFRSMRTDTPAVATHLLSNPQSYLTPIGGFLRKSSLDELPQLWSILRGDMSFVGPRPALFNQHDLIVLRERHGVHELVPGLTGWAQVNGRDELSTPDKVRLDAEYLERRSLGFDLRILWLTLMKVLRRDGVSH